MPKELKQAIKQLRNGKCNDTAGIAAEMIKEGGASLQEHLLRLYNDVAQPGSTPPAQWKERVIKVLHKSGDTKVPHNYCPIAIIPLLYKLYARLLYNRLEPLLDKHQSPDRAGFRHNYCTADHLYTTTLLHERSHEWQLGLWLATVDFQKAFHTINHNKLWTTLAKQGIPDGYIHQLQALYQDQTAIVRTDAQSKGFSIERGVKQGDPLSSLLFNSCLRTCSSNLNTSGLQNNMAYNWASHQTQS